MYLVKVAPISMIPKTQNQVLNYFFSGGLNPGDVVSVSLRNRKLDAVVMGCSNLLNQKLFVKKLANFSLKKIEKIKRSGVLSKLQLEMAEWLSDYYFAPLGLCLKTVMPAFWKNKKFIPWPRQEHLEKKNLKPLFIADQSISKYQELISSIDGQVLIITPQKVSAKILQDKLDLAKTQSVFVHAGLSGKQKLDCQLQIQNGSSLIIGTRSALFYNFKNLKLVLVRDASSKNYYSDMTPKYFAPLVALKMARLYNAQVIFTGFPNLELLQHENLGNLGLEVPKSNSRFELVDMRKETPRGSFIFSRPVKERVVNSFKAGVNILLFSNRRGYSAYLCKYCGLIFRCPQCGASLTLHKLPDPKLICHHCNIKIAIPKQCPECESYNLGPYGFGTERVEKELKRLFPEIPLVSLDQDKINEEDGISIIKRWLEKPSALIATSMILSYLDYIVNAQKPLDYAQGKPGLTTVVLNMEEILNMPDFRINAKLVGQLYSLRSLSQKMIIQTFQPEHEIFSTMEQGTYLEFLKEELGKRKIHAYPPFSQIARLIFKSPNLNKAYFEANRNYRQIQSKKKILETQDFQFEVLPPNAPLKFKDRGWYVYNLILKIASPLDFSSGEFLEKRNQLFYGLNLGEVQIDPKEII